MNDFIPKPLPRGYGVAAEEPPPERQMGKCECGCDYDDHSEEADASVMKEELEKIKGKLEFLLTREVGSEEVVALLLHTQNGLNVCGCGRCAGYKEVEVDPKDDGDLACDEARGT